MRYPITMVDTKRSLHTLNFKLFVIIKADAAPRGKAHDMKLMGSEIQNIVGPAKFVTEIPRNFVRRPGFLAQL